MHFLTILWTSPDFGLFEVSSLNPDIGDPYCIFGKFEVQIFWNTIIKTFTVSLKKAKQLEVVLEFFVNLFKK